MAVEKFSIGRGRPKLSPLPEYGKQNNPFNAKGLNSSGM
jgi:hypothetical protein